MSDQEKARSLNRQVYVLLQQLDGKGDSSSYYSTVTAIVRAAVSCDAYDSKPDRKGRIKPKYRAENQKRVGPLLGKIVEAGLFDYQLKRNAKALNDFELYIESVRSPLFYKPDSRETDIGRVAYYASLLAYGTKDYAKAERYADEALKDNTFAKDAAEIKVRCMKVNMKTETDSTKYLIALLELHDKAPENMNYFKMLMEYFSAPGHEGEMEQFASDEIRKDSTNKLAWVLKGETRMRRHSWDEAISAYKRVVRIDSVFVEALYNIGICYSSKAIETKDSLAEAKTLSEENVQRVKGDFEEARTYLERVSMLDPQREQVDWTIPLYQVYYVLDDERAEQIKRLMK